MAAADDWYTAGIMVSPPSELVRCEMTNEELTTVLAEIRERTNAQDTRIAAMQNRIDVIAEIIERNFGFSASHETWRLPPPHDRVELAAKLAQLKFPVPFLFGSREQGFCLPKDSCETIIAFLAQEGALR